MKSGILYSLSNPYWNNLLKNGKTINLRQRLRAFHTSLPDDCEIVCITNELLNVHFYENYMKKILKDFRYSPKREFFCVKHETIISLYELFNTINHLYNTEEELNEYIKTIFPLSIKRVKVFPLKKKRKPIFIDTSYEILCAS